MAGLSYHFAVSAGSSYGADTHCYFARNLLKPGVTHKVEKGVESDRCRNKLAINH